MIDEHPGGPDAQFVEDTIVPDEQETYRRQVQQLLNRGYTPCLELAETAYTMLHLVRLRASMEDDRGALRPTTKQTLQAYGDQLALLRMQIQTLDKRQAQLTEIDPDRELRDAEAWIQAHLGEFEHVCPHCAQMLTIPALPHWAYAPVYVDGKPQPVVWSPELFALVWDKTISLWAMAFILRTSPEALRLTAERRGDAWPEWIDLVAEELALGIRLRALDRLTLQPGP